MYIQKKIMGFLDTTILFLFCKLANKVVLQKIIE